MIKKKINFNFYFILIITNLFYLYNSKDIFEDY